MSKHFLLTGATGLVGHYLVRDFLLEGVPLAVLIRAGKAQSARERLDQILEHWEEDLGRALPRPMCLEGDITQPELGLSGQHRRWVTRHCGSVIHNAASLKFNGNDRQQDPWLSNITGTNHVLEMCRTLGLR